MREEYDNPPLEASDLLESPYEQLRKWLTDAMEAWMPEPCAMCLSTVDAEGRPSSRMVLLRGLDEHGIIFYTNYHSRKGLEITANHWVSICMWWGDLHRQVRVEGRVEKATEAESNAYFHSRPRDSQLASAASPQSQVIASREELDSLIHTVEAEHPNEVPRPAHWGGYRIVPDRFEFWQGRPARRHDRLVYVKHGEGWRIERLAP